MMLGVFSVNETKGQEEVKKILRGALHDASGVPADALSLRLQMTPVIGPGWDHQTCSSIFGYLSWVPVFGVFGARSSLGKDHPGELCATYA